MDYKKLLQSIIRKFRGWNLRLDRETHSISDDELEIESGRKVLTQIMLLS